MEGLIRAVSILDEVIATIRSSKDKRDAKNNLISEYDFTEAQAEAIVTLQLYRLTNTDITTLEKESNDLDKLIKKLESILGSEKKLVSVIKKELLEIRKKYADARMTRIEEEIEEIKVNLEVMVPSEDVIVTVTEDGYVKRTSPRSYAASNGKDFGMKETDFLLRQFDSNTTNTILLFTNKGSYIYLPVHALPDIRWKDLGQHVANLCPIDSDERIIEAMEINEFEDERFLVFVTKQGMIKKTELSQYKAQRYSKPLMALKLKKDDELVDVYVTNGKNEVFIATHFGYGLRFKEEEVNVVGQRASGVKGINLKDDDFVVSGILFDTTTKFDLFLLTHRGAVKKMPLSEFDLASRAKRGVVMLRELKSNPHRVVGVKTVTKGDTVIVRTEKGEPVQIDPSSYRPNDRYSNGSFIVDVADTGNACELKKESNTD